MPLLECPHCYATVLPKASGECPSCRRDTRNTAGTDQSRCSVLLDECERLPDVCVSCGQYTDRWTLIRRKRTTRGDSLFLRLFFMITHPVHYLMLGDRGVTHRVELSVPLCPGCSATATPEPLFVDFDSCRIELIVHREFRRQLSDLRGRRVAGTGS